MLLSYLIIYTYMFLVNKHIPKVLVRLLYVTTELDDVQLYIMFHQLVRGMDYVVLHHLILVLLLSRQIPFII